MLIFSKFAMLQLDTGMTGSNSSERVDLMYSRKCSNLCVAAAFAERRKNNVRACEGLLDDLQNRWHLRRVKTFEETLNEVFSSETVCGYGRLWSQDYGRCT